MPWKSEFGMILQSAEIHWHPFLFLLYICSYTAIIEFAGGRGTAINYFHKEAWIPSVRPDPRWLFCEEEGTDRVSI